MSLCSRAHVTLLQRIIDEECDIMQIYFRYHLSNCPQLNGGLLEESEHIGEKLKAELEVLTFEHQRRIIDIFIYNMSAQKRSIFERI